MFIRRKPNKSGTFSVQAISKVKGIYKVQKSFGTSSDEEDLKNLEQEAIDWISKYSGQLEIDFAGLEEADGRRLNVESVLNDIDRGLLNGPFLILERIL